MTKLNPSDSRSMFDLESAVDRRRMLQMVGIRPEPRGRPMLAPSALAAGIGNPTKTEPTKGFKPSNAMGAKPSLPAAAAYALDINEGEPAQWNSWMQKSCPKFGLAFTSTNSNQNAATQVQQVDGILQKGVAGLMIDAVDTSVAPTLLNAMKSGVAVFALNYQTCTCQLGANQYDQAKMSTEAAVSYIKKHYGGKADVVYINWNANIAIKPRDTAVHDASRRPVPASSSSLTFRQGQ